MQKYNGALLRKFDDDIEGNASVGTSVVVRNKSDNTLAAIYDVDDTNSIQKPNPFVTDAFGRYSFFAPNGKYILEFGDGSDTIEVTLADNITHNDLINLNAAGGHDAIYARTFANVDAMLAFNGLQVGQRYSTGGTTWEYLGGGGTITNFKALNGVWSGDFGTSTADIQAALNVGGVVHIKEGTYNMSTTLNVPAGTTLKGAGRDITSLVFPDGVDGVKLSGGTALKSLRLFSTIDDTATSTTSKGIDADDVSQVLVEDVRVLYFGYGYFAENLIWLHELTRVRIENPRLYGVYMNNTTTHLECYLNQVYVVNDYAVDNNLIISYYIEGTIGTTMHLCTSDGGNNVGRSSVGLRAVGAVLSIESCHFENYKVRPNGIAGAEYDAIVSLSGSTVNIDGLRFHNVLTDTPNDSALLYSENSSEVSVSRMDANTFTYNHFTAQTVGISNDFIENVITFVTPHKKERLGFPRGTGSGIAWYERKGIQQKLTLTEANTLLDVNTVSFIKVLDGNVGTTSLAGFTGQHSNGQKVTVQFHNGIPMLHSASFKLLGGVNVTPPNYTVSEFIYMQQLGYWAEVARSAV